MARTNSAAFPRARSRASVPSQSRRTVRLKPTDACPDEVVVDHTTNCAYADRVTGTTRVPLPGLISQVLVALTTEFDNGFEDRMRSGGHPRPLSVVVHANLLRFVPADGVTVVDLARASGESVDRLATVVAALERWGCVTLQGDPKRDGRGSSSTVKPSFRVTPPEATLTGMESWEAFLRELEARHPELAEVPSVSPGLPAALPYAGPAGSRFVPSATSAPLGGAYERLSQALQAFTLDFDAYASIPLMFCANLLRVCTPEGVPLKELHVLSGQPRKGIEPLSCHLRWGWVTVEQRVARLTAVAENAKRCYPILAAKIEATGRYDGLRDLLTAALASRDAEGRSTLGQAMVPPAHTHRAGDWMWFDGHRTMPKSHGARLRDLVTKTRRWVEDPERYLPHFPLWDGDNGFSF